MGEMAYLVNSSLIDEEDQENLSLDFLLGLNNETTAVFKDIEHLLYNETLRKKHYYLGPKTKSCKYCGKRGLHWGQDENDNWRLFNTEGEIHSCTAYKRRMNNGFR